MSSFGEEYGKLIRKRRESYGESLEQAALGAFGEANKKSRISELENGKVKRPQAKTIAALNAHFAITDDEVEACRNPTAPDPAQQTHIDALTAYVARLQTQLDAQRAELQSAHEDEAKILHAQIVELESRIADPEAALQKAEKTIAALRAEIERDSNLLPEGLEAEAQKALDDKDLPKAEEIFDLIIDGEELAIQRAARAHFAKGQIAEEQVRWPDAQTHYTRAAELHPCFKHLRQSWDFLWKLGDYSKSFDEAEKLVSAAIEEQGEFSHEHGTSLACRGLSCRHVNDLEGAVESTRKSNEIAHRNLGKDHPDYAASLNNLASLYYAINRLEDAEPLAKQASDISKAALGENHPTYAISLSNLAALYRGMSRLEDAESLYKKAIELGKATIGENHPDYAMLLNNLGHLYAETDRLDKALPLMVQAVEITANNLGADHPQTQTMANTITALKSRLSAS
ncbi:tetratricopeptide repeat protein [Roseovarius sp. 2305UL8-3]|uniref:tetratricopeptide repeat protein n=1 Tax=Roseovarius conchicola TaxID=3121636 RepID=UPI003528E3A1